MKLNDAAAKLVSALYPVREFDDSAETMRELCEHWGCSVSQGHVRISDLLRRGIVEQVWKLTRNRPTPAYRMKGKVVCRLNK